VAVDGEEEVRLICCKTLDLARTVRSLALADPIRAVGICKRDIGRLLVDLMCNITLPINSGPPQCTIPLLS
jgi:hypothetical protein